MDIQIDINAVLNTAEQIQLTNQIISDDFSIIKSAIKKLENEWESPANDLAVDKIRYLENRFVDARYGVINTFVLFMKNQVGEGYETLEKKLSTAASAFK